MDANLGQKKEPSEDSRLEFSPWLCDGTKMVQNLQLNGI